jgi:hypothetical protein
MAGRYTPLENYLRGLPESQREMTLGFAQIESILKAKLPSSAYEDQRWWLKETEANHVSARSWTKAGWKVDSLDVNKKRVHLIRIG